MKYESQHPIPASPATTVMFRTGVSVGEMAASDCPMAADHIAHVMGGGRQAHHPITLLRKAYGI